MLVSMSCLFYEPNYVHIYIALSKIAQSIFRLSHYSTREAVKMRPSEILHPWLAIIVKFLTVLAADGKRRCIFGYQGGGQ
jgi:hypothetical protein